MSAKKSGIDLPPGFQWSPVHFGHGDAPVDNPNPPLGVLEEFRNKTFVGTGFNTIFRPNNIFPTTTFNPPVIPAPPTPPNTAVLELNLTEEEFHFSNELGTVPNRGFQNQGDISLNGISYMQTVKDVANLKTGKADGPPTDIHAETGFFMNVPASNVNPVVGDTIVRMASIPHGTTINAQGGLDAPPDVDGPPDIGPRDITPFVLDGDKRTPKPKDSQTASNTDTPRLPQDLTLFIKEGTITQAILNDPITVLRNVNNQLNITKTVTFNLTTSNAAPLSGPTNTSPKEGGGTSNIAFLVGQTPPVPNANAVEMDATFWIETVQSTVTVPAFSPGTKYPLQLQPNFKPLDGTSPPPLPTFLVTPTQDMTAPKDVNVEYKQMQYAQMVFLQFGGLVWPHASVATLVPAEPFVVDRLVLPSVE